MRVKPRGFTMINGDDSESSSNSYRWPTGCWFRAGDAVRVTAGPLAEATGVVQQVLPDQRCAIALDGLSGGVAIVVPAAWLEMADPLGS